MVESKNGFLGRYSLKLANVLLSVNDLPVKIRLLDSVTIHYTDCSNTSSCQVEASRGPKSTSTDNEHSGCFEFLLSLDSNVAH